MTSHEWDASVNAEIQRRFVEPVLWKPYSCQYCHDSGYKYWLTGGSDEGERCECEAGDVV